MSNLMIDSTSGGNVFDFDGGRVRVLTAQDGVVLFVAADVASALGYADTDKAVRDHCKRMKTFKADELSGLGLANPPTRGMVLVPESDVFRLAMRSTLESAERFQDWVAEEVLPSIRRTGEYRAAARSEAEKAREMSAVYAKLADALERDEKIRRENVLLKRVEPVPGHAHISVKDIKREYAPYLAEAKLRLVLRYYGQGRTRFQFGVHENASFPVFQRDGLEDVFDRFLNDCDVRISMSRTSAIVEHECFDGETVRVPRDVAVEWLHLDDDDFR